MTEKDRTANVPVDVGRLRNGIRTMFLGMSEIFDSIGAEEAAGIVTTGKAAAGDALPADGKAEEVSATQTEKPEQKEDQKPAADGEETTKSTLTLADLQKVAGSKIIADRSNQVKIQQIIKSFGVDNLSALKKGQYEAFMTQLGAL